MHKDKAQIWGIDLMIAVFIFSIILTIFFIYTINIPNETQEAFSYLQSDGGIITESLLSEGFPKNWTESNVIRIGLLSDNKVNQTKLEQFYNLTLTEENYTRTKDLFNTRYDYFFFFTENITIGGTDVEGIGKPGTMVDSISAQNLIRVTRFTIYKDKPTTAYLYIWEE